LGAFAVLSVYVIAREGGIEVTTREEEGRKARKEGIVDSSPRGTRLVRVSYAAGASRLDRIHLSMKEGRGEKKEVHIALSPSFPFVR